MITRAQGYTPAIIYVESGANMRRHTCVRLTTGAVAVPADINGSSHAIGFTMQDSSVGDYVPVQTDGVLYDWSGSAVLIPGYEYYQGSGGSIVLAPPSDEPWPVGVAVTATTFQIRIGAGGGGASVVSSSGWYDDYIYIKDVDVVNQYIELAEPFADASECLAVILGGGSLHLIPGIDFNLEQSASTFFDRLSWVNLNESILRRALKDDMITLTRKGIPLPDSSATAIVYLENGTVVSEAMAMLQLLNNGAPIGAPAVLMTQPIN